MAWFKVDDGFYSHPKVLSIPREARALALGTWIVAGTWSADKLTDGKIPAHMVVELGGSVEGAESLVKVRLWSKTRTGYLFVNWRQFQPTRAEVDARRQGERDRKAAYRAASQQPRGSVPHVSQGDNDGFQTPRTRTRTRPVPVAKATSETKRGSRIPPDFVIDDLARQWAKSNAPAIDVDAELDKFRDYWAAAAGAKGVKLDWSATWRNWMRNAQKFAVERGWTPQREVPQGQEWLNR